MFYRRYKGYNFGIALEKYDNIDFGYIITGFLNFDAYLLLR